MKKREKKSKVHTMDVILIIVAILLITFTISMIQTFKETGSIPDTLVQCVFAILGGECGVLGWIKTTKDKYTQRKWDKEDNVHSDTKNVNNNSPNVEADEYEPKG